MGAYIVRRLLLMIPTLFGMLVVSFFITQLAPGGPVESYIAQISGQSVSVSEGVIGNSEGDFAGQNVVTSGLGTVFPQGIPVGTILDTKVQDGLFTQARVRLAADLGRLQEVWVMLP